MPVMFRRITVKTNGVVPLSVAGSDTSLIETSLGGGAGVTTTGGEKSEVFPSGLVTVAVMNQPTGTGSLKSARKVISPLAPVLLVSEPTYCSASPSPLVPGPELAKNSS